jgi:hypothetical protein
MTDFQYHTIPIDRMASFLAVVNIKDSADVLGDFKSPKASFFELAEPLLECLENPEVSQERSYFYGQTPGCLPSIGPVTTSISSRMGWCAAFTVQHRLTPHLRRIFDHPNSYDLGDTAREVRVSFLVLNTRLVSDHFTPPWVR